MAATELDSKFATKAARSCYNKINTFNKQKFAILLESGCFGGSLRGSLSSDVSPPPPGDMRGTQIEPGRVPIVLTAEDHILLARRTAMWI